MGSAFPLPKSSLQKTVEWTNYHFGCRYLFKTTIMEYVNIAHLIDET